MTDQQESCPQCASTVRHDDRFCETCGATLGGPVHESVAAVAAQIEPPAPAPVELTTVGEVRSVAIPRATEGPSGPCSDCGNETYADGYCTSCGHLRAAPDRDEAELGSVTLITDRGLVHSRNEDAAAAGIVSGGPGESEMVIVVAVCDGVSTSGEAQLAAVAASKAGVESMLGTLTASRDACAAVLAGLADAASAAAAAGTGADSSAAPSCTYTAAVVVPNPEGAPQITVGNVGDSRAYWLPAPPAPAEQLTVDDSVAQELVTAGASPDSEMVRRGAHTLTRWLGADAEPTPWSGSSVRTVTPDGPGWLLLCSDGLWNYLPDADDIARFCTGTDAIATVRALTQHALSAGGHDNITVALIPIGRPHEFH